MACSIFVVACRILHYGAPSLVMALGLSGFVANGILVPRMHVCIVVTQSCLTLCDPMDCSPPGSSVRGILQAGILEWVAIPFSRGSSQPNRSNTSLLHFGQILHHLSHQGSPLVPQVGIKPLCPVFQGRFLTTGPRGKSQSLHLKSKKDTGSAQGEKFRSSHKSGKVL